LPNNNVIACGSMPTPGNTAGVGLLDFLDPAGHLLEQRLVFPRDDRGFFGSDFWQCLRWGDGVGVVGTATNGREGVGWIMKLTGRGAKQWELVSADVVGLHGVIFGRSLITAGSNTDIHRVTESGELLKRAHIESDGFDLVVPLATATSLSVITYQQNGRMALHILTEDLRDTTAPIWIDAIEGITTNPGTGFALPDGTIALFGKQILPNGVAVAAIARLGATGNTATLQQMQTPGAVAYSIYDATPIAPGRFVAVRGEVDPQGEHVVMSWVTFE